MQSGPVGMHLEMHLWAAVVEESGGGAGGASSSSVSNMGGAEGKASSIVLNGVFGLGVLFCECRARRCRLITGSS